MEIIHGKIIDITPEGLLIKAPYTNIDRACFRKYSMVDIGLNDGRYISNEQRKKAYALMKEIAEWSGYLPEYVKRLMKTEFVVKRMQSLNKEIFSLSSCDMTTAKEFITYLIDFIIEYEIPTKQPLRELCEDINKYIYMCLLHKKCCICGTKAELHHVTAIGMGRDRTEVFQIGIPVLPLCRKHHIEWHTLGSNTFNAKYHVESVKLTKEIAKKYNLTKKNMEVRTK